MAKRKIRPAIDKNGRVLLRVSDTGINQLLMMLGGFTFVVFGNEKATYVPIEDVIAWYEDESKQEPGSKRKKLLCEALEKVRAIKANCETGVAQ